MSLSQRFEALLVEKDQHRCRVGQVLGRLEIEDPEAAEVLKRVLATPHVSTRSIKLELDANGDRICRDRISAHRHGQCNCEVSQ